MNMFTALVHFMLLGIAICHPKDFFMPHGMAAHDYVLVDPPKYVYADYDEDNGFFYHELGDYIPVFHKYSAKNIYISVNGYITFNSPLRSNKAESYPAPVPSISVYHTDLVFTNDPLSALTFNEYTYGPVLVQAAEEIKYLAHRHFKPTRVFVVTWIHAYKYYGTSYKDRASFQLVLATDNYETYIIQNYGDLYHEFCPVTIGWQAGDREETRHDFYQHPNMQLIPGVPNNLETNRPLRMQIESNVEIPGKWIYRIFKTTNEDLNGHVVPTPNPHAVTGTTRGTPVPCPSKESGICKGKTGNIIWPYHPYFFISCVPHSNPICMSCPANTYYVQRCDACLSSYKEGCPKKQNPSKPIQHHPSISCNKNAAIRFCKTKRSGRYTNYNDIRGRTFYWCVGVHSNCMSCNHGEEFCQSKRKKNDGHCKHSTRISPYYY